MEPIEKEGERDQEIDDVRRLPVEEAIDTLSYDSDRKLVEALEPGVLQPCSSFAAASSTIHSSAP
jgi:hypothetical protein